MKSIPKQSTRRVHSVLLTCPHWLFLLATLATGCGASTSDSSGSSTHFLGQCSSTEACDEGLSCLCGVCTQTCVDDDDCSNFSASACGLGSGPSCEEQGSRVCLARELTEASIVMGAPSVDAATSPNVSTNSEAGAAATFSVAASASSAASSSVDAGTIVEVQDAEAPSASMLPVDAAATEYPTVTFDPPGGVPWDPPLAVMSQPECIVDFAGMITTTNQTSGTSWTEPWSYDDASGTLLRQKASSVTAFVFDPGGRLLLYGDLIQYERDSHGNMTKRTSGNNAANYSLTYDEDDRLIQSNDSYADWPGPGGAPSLRRKYEYDSAGRCARVWYSTTLGENYFYDAQERLIRRELRDGESFLGVSYYLYDEAGLVAWIEDGWNAASSTAPLDGLADHVVRRAPDGAGGFVIQELYFSLATEERNRPYGSFREHELPWYPVDSNAMVVREGETTSVSRSEIRVSAECLQLGLPQRSPTSDLCTFDHAKPGLPFGWL